MTAVPGLAIFAAALAVGVPRLILTASWTDRAPRLGVLAWQASAVATVLAAGLAGVAAVLHWGASHDLVGTAWQVCLNALRGAHGPAAQVAAAAGLVLLAAVALRLLLGWWREVAGAAWQRRRHRAMLRLAEVRRDGRAGDEITVLAHPEPVAYVVPGRSPRVVVSTATLDRLSDSELAAVLAHERAHAAGYHHWLVGGSWLLRRAFPRIPVFTHTARETTRLVEMCADDAATQHHSRLALARALVAMAGPVPAAGALPAAGGDAADRLRRLLYPPRPLPAAASGLVAVGFGALPLLPPVLVLLAAIS
jgi:Zn-dependent protease with chaperone function